MKSIVFLTVSVCCFLSSPDVSAQQLAVDSGQIDLLLSDDFLTAFRLFQIDRTDDVIRPGGLGPNSNRFVANSRTATQRATDFLFTVGQPESAQGLIATSGFIFFDDLVTPRIPAGDLSLGYDTGRITDTTSGFFVFGTVEEIQAPLFDLGSDTIASATSESFSVSSDLLTLSPELTIGLSRPDRIVPPGVVAGSISVTGNVAAIPEPGSGSVCLLGLLTIAAKRRSRAI